VRLLPLLPWLILATGCRVGFELVRQNGRILLRLDALEQRLAELTAVAAAAPRPTPAPALQAGLSVGTPAPDFELPDLAGGRHSLAALRGRRVLLVSFSPQCGYCLQMLPQLATLSVDGPAGTPTPLVISTGDAEQNRRLVAEHGLRCLVLLQNANEVTAKYGLHGTPMGYLIDETGRIASEVATGADAIFALAHHAGSNASAGGAETDHKAYRGNRPLTESRIARDGLSVGTTAPAFTLPRVDGGDLALADFRGGPLLLVFSDPNCGPCAELAPQLEVFHRRTPHVQLLMISRGDVESNRRKVAEVRLSFPVVLQKQWEISRRYAMFATPIGYLIDRNGIIAADVAVGVEPILALATRAAIVNAPTEASRASEQLEH
jgi:peroxiredoxin